MRNARLYVAAATLALLGSMAGAHAEQHAIAIIGTGNVGSALGERFGALGHRIVYGSRTPADAEVAALVERSGPGARRGAGPGGARFQAARAPDPVPRCIRAA
jgi:lactate dehydrogenase-like 2-hydroxyacid dehydrogenase